MGGAEGVVVVLSGLPFSGTLLTSPLIGTLSLALVTPLSITYDIVFEHVSSPQAPPSDLSTF